MVGVARAAVNGSLKGFQAAGRLGAAWVSDCVADGAPELVAICHFTTRRTGTVLRTRQGHWEAAVPQALA